MDYYVKVKVFKTDKDQGIDSHLDKSVEFEVFFGRIPLSNKGKEITINWSAQNLNGNEQFYTDANSMKML